MCNFNFKIPGFFAEASITGRILEHSSVSEGINSLAFPRHEYTMFTNSSSSGQKVIPQLRPQCQPRCICWPDGCLCFLDCTRGYPI